MAKVNCAYDSVFPFIIFRKTKKLIVSKFLSTGTIGFKMCTLILIGKIRLPNSGKPENRFTFLPLIVDSFV